MIGDIKFVVFYWLFDDIFLIMGVSEYYVRMEDMGNFLIFKFFLKFSGLKLIYVNFINLIW